MVNPMGPALPLPPGVTPGQTGGSVEDTETCLFQEFERIEGAADQGGVRTMLLALASHSVLSVRVLPAAAN
ncbi:MAG: hypothetical protein RJA70_2524 [Pseudomonadota bacterium]|jgi:hypothetical protein